MGIVLLLLSVILYSFIIKKLFIDKKIRYDYCRDIPYDDIPAYVGKVVKGHIDGNDLVATIMDLINRGYIESSLVSDKGKEKRLLVKSINYTISELDECEYFILNQLFKNDNEIIFDDYLKSKQFLIDYKAFDKMLDRKVKRKSYMNNSLIKNISKIIFFISFFFAGIFIVYSLIIPLSMFMFKILNLVSAKNCVIFTFLISIILYFFIFSKFVKFVNKYTSSLENINLNIIYIILFIVVMLLISFVSFDSICNFFINEFKLINIFINFFISVFVILYMFNIIKHDDKQDYLYYLFIIMNVFFIIFSFKMAMCISIVFFALFVFLKLPRRIKIIDDEYVEKWLAFKRFIEDYTILNEQEENAMLIWDRYLIYAISLGVNKKVIKKFKNISNNLLISDQFLNKMYIEYFD